MAPAPRTSSRRHTRMPGVDFLAAYRPTRTTRPRSRTMTDSVKYLLDESRIPTRWYNLAGRPAEAAPAGAAPRHAAAARPRRSRAALPDGADRAGGDAGARDPDPRAGARRLPPVAPVAALPRAAAREGAADAGAHLLQVRRRLARRQPQAEHRGRAGVLQPRSRRQEARAPRPAPASGARRSRLPARCSASTCRSSWCACRTTRSRTAAR